MYDAIPNPEGEPAPGAEPGAVEMARALARRQLAVLDRMIEAGANIMVTVERRAMAEAEIHPGEDGPELPNQRRDPVIAYARITRSMRLTQAAQTRIIKDLLALENDEAGRRKVELAETAHTRQAVIGARKARVWREVEPLAIEAVAEREASEDAEDGAFYFEVFDYEKQTGLILDEAAEDGELLEAPLGALVERVCQRLDLDPNWPALAQQPWATAEAQTGDPRSPFVRLAETQEPQAASP